MKTRVNDFEDLNQGRGGLAFACLLVLSFWVVAEPNTLPVLAVDSFTLANRLRAGHVERDGDVPLGAIIRTDERYNKDSLFYGPRGWDYWNLLQNPQPYQNPNLWPDKRPTYFFGQLVMPAGSSLTIHGRFPHARYFKFNFYKFERNTFVAIPDAALAGYDIEPDPGSGNPFRVGADRQVKNRNFTINVLAEEPPANPAELAKNAIYVGRDKSELMAGFRIYVSDKGYDGVGWGPADTPSSEGPGITCEGELADGTRLSNEEVIRQFGRPMGAAPPPLTVDQWYKLIDSKENDSSLTPATAPARRDGQFELFRGMKYSLLGAFMKREDRARIPVATVMEGGGDPTTEYMINFLSREFGPVYVFRAKLPTFPDTFAGTKIMPEGQVSYWSVVTVASAMLIGEDLHIGSWLKDKPVLYSSLYKSLVFSVFLIAFYILEEVVVGVFKGRTISQSFPSIGGGSLQGLLSMGAMVFIALIPFFAFREFGRVIGRRELWSLLLKSGTRIRVSVILGKFA